MILLVVTSAGLVDLVQLHDGETVEGPRECEGQPGTLGWDVVTGGAETVYTARGSHAEVHETQRDARIAAARLREVIEVMSQ